MNQKSLSLSIFLAAALCFAAVYSISLSSKAKGTDEVSQSKVLTFRPKSDANAASKLPSVFISKPIDAVQSSVIPECAAILLLLAILLFKLDNEFLLYPDPPELDGHFRILFRTIISPNAP